MIIVPGCTPDALVEEGRVLVAVVFRLLWLVIVVKLMPSAADNVCGCCLVASFNVVVAVAPTPPPLDCCCTRMSWVALTEVLCAPPAPGRTIAFEVTVVRAIWTWGRV